VQAIHTRFHRPQGTAGEANKGLDFNPSQTKLDRITFVQTSQCTKNTSARPHLLGTLEGLIWRRGTHDCEA